MNDGTKPTLKAPLKKGCPQPASGGNRAVIYVRVSTKDQVENFSLATQEKACRDYCTRNGCVVDKVFVEEGESAKTANRAEFQKMLAHCRENKCRVKWVVVYQVSRFARSSHDHLQTRALLAGLGVSLRSVTEHFDESSQGKLMESILASFAQFDNDVRAERTVAGMKAAVQAGKWTFKAPPGYINSKNPGPSLVHDPELGPLVRQAFDLYATGLHTKQKVLEIVAAAGLRARNGKPMSKQTFNAMLRKPVYAGWIQVAEWGERVRGDFEPLVTQEVFDTVQALMDGKRVSVTPRLRSNPAFPLRHFVKCGCCGKPLTASLCKGRKEKYGYYWCHNRRCGRRPRARTADLERAFEALLTQMQPKPEYVKLFNEIVLDVWKQKQAENVTLSVSIKQRLEELRGRQEQLDEAFLYKKAIDRETYERQRDKLNEQIVLAEMQERDAKLEEYDVEAVLAFAEHVILNAARLWMESASEQKQRLQKVLFPEGVRFEDGVIKTGATCLLFNLLAESQGENTSLATLPGFEPGPPP